MALAPNFVFTIFAFVSFFLCLIRFTTQWHAWNVCIHILVAWVGLLCLSSGINSIIWNKNTANWAPVWCDISSRLTLTMNVGLAGTMLSINRRLYFLASPTFHTEKNKRCEIVIDLAIGIGLPIIYMILYFFVQEFRFLIVEDFGCFPSVLPSWLSIVIINVPPVLLELLGGLYGGLSIHAFLKRRSGMNELLSSHENLNSNRYLRVMCFSIIDLLTGTPIPVTFLYLAIAAGLSPFPGLKQEHRDLSLVIQLPAAVWRDTGTTSELTFEFTRWSPVFIALLFFCIFGLSEEARNGYRTGFQTVVRVFKMMAGFKSGAPVGEVEEFIFKAPTPSPVDTMNSDTRPFVVSTSSSTVSPTLYSDAT